MSTRLTDSIQHLADALSASACDGDWQTLARLDQEVATLLRRIQPAPAALAPALAKLQSAHQHASQLAGEHADALQEKLATMNEHSEGLRAYEQMGEMA